MILQKLCEYYDAHQKELPRFGCGREPISFCLLIDRDGNLVEIEDVRDHSGKRPQPRSMEVPAFSGKRTVGIKPHLLWDNTKYVLGINDTRGCFETFKEYHASLLATTSHPVLEPLCRFLEKWDPHTWESATLRDGRPLPYKEELSSGANVVFRLEGEREYLHEKEEARDLIQSWYIQQEGEEEDLQEGTCLVTGEKAAIARLHPAITGVRGGQSSGVALVSYNLPSFSSYGKTQNFNAPVSIEAAFKYTSALRHLIRQEPRLFLGDTQILFWTDRPSREMELLWGFTINGEEGLRLKEEKEKKRFVEFFSRILQGRLPEELDPSLRYYVLGISPNNARLAVNFWYTDTIEAFVRGIRQHFEDITLQKDSPHREDHPCLNTLLFSLVPPNQQKERDKALPRPLRIAVFRAFLTGLPYPQTLLQRALARIRTDGRVDYYRVALVKGYLARWQRIKNHQQEVTMALDPTSTNTAYRLGRLFAVLEKAQEEALGGVNSTIKDRFFSSASTTPKRVFPYLIRLSQHHLAKVGQANVGRKVNLEKTIQEILHGIDDFPAFLPLEEQGMFALGYYHQRQALFQSRE